MKIADDLPFDLYDEPALEKGDYWSNYEGDKDYPKIVRPIGFMRDKPRVRVKAWTAPILPAK